MLRTVLLHFRSLIFRLFYKTGDGNIQSLCVWIPQQEDGDSLSQPGLSAIENLYTWKQACMRPDPKSQKILVRWKIGISLVRSTVNYKNTKNWLFRSSDGKSTIGELTKILKSIEPDSDAYGDLSESPILQNSVSDTTIHLNAENYNDVIRPQKDTILLSKGISE